MPELIQFDCPSCAATLRVPLEMAGLRGPCPLCHQDIVAPNPYTGIGAHFPALETDPGDIGFADPIPPKPEPEPETRPEPPSGVEPAPATTRHPFADKLIESAPITENTPLPTYRVDEPEKPVALPVEKRRKTGVWILATLAGLVLALAAGFFIGNHFRHDPSEGPLIVAPPPPKPLPPPVAAELPPPDPEPEESAEPPAPAVNKTSLESARATLRAFLEAPDWAARSAYVLSPDTVRVKMEAYAKNNDDGPTPFDSFEIEHSQVDADSGTTLFIFKVESPAAPGGIPVAILETPKGWLVDWESFVEFRDDLFKEFAEGPSDHVGEFHVVVTAQPEASAAQLENETFASFLIAPPLPDRQKTAFIKKTNPAYSQLRDATANGRVFAPVLKITKSSTKDGRGYLEILSIQATDWRPRGAMPGP